MDAQQIQRLEPELARYLREFDDCFGRVEPARHRRRRMRSAPLWKPTRRRLRHGVTRCGWQGR